MNKPTAYFDTSIISAYWSEGPDVTLIARRLHTRIWWDSERKHFDLWASEFAESELKVGHFPRQEDCLKMVRKLRFLPATADARKLIKAIIELRIVPAAKAVDAAHLAMSAIHGIDYLLTWNYAHMANPMVRPIVRHNGNPGSAHGLSRNYPPSSPWAFDSEGAIIMPDPLLDEIWRVRQELLKKHGGIDGYFDYIQKLDRLRRQRKRPPKAKKGRKPTAKASKS